jgi:hypothetical protein
MAKAAKRRLSLAEGSHTLAAEFLADLHGQWQWHGREILDRLSDERPEVIFKFDGQACGGSAPSARQAKGLRPATDSRGGIASVGDGSMAHLMTRDGPRYVAVNIARLPGIAAAVLMSGGNERLDLLFDHGINDGAGPSPRGGKRKSKYSSVRMAFIRSLTIALNRSVSRSNSHWRGTTCGLGAKTDSDAVCRLANRSSASPGLLCSKMRPNIPLLGRQRCAINRRTAL